MRFLLGIPTVAAISITSAAWAIYGQPVTITGEGADEIPAQSITFITSTGTEVPVEEDDDDGFIILFPGDFATSGQLRIDMPGGPRLIDIPAAGPGETIHIDLDTGMAVSRPDGMFGMPSAGEPAPSPISIFYESISLDQPAIGFGTMIEGGSSGETPVAALDGALDLTGGTFQGGLPIDAGPAQFFFFSYSQADGSDDAQGSVAPSAYDVAIAYQDFSPSDSTGLFLGPLGLDAWARRSVDVTNFKIGLGGAPIELGTDGRSRLYPGIFIDRATIDTNIQSQVTTPAYNDIYQQTDLNFEQVLTAFGFGATYIRALNDVLSVGFGTYGLLVNSETDMSSMQMNVCGVCSGATFDSAVYDSQDSTSLGFKGNAFMDFRITDNVSLTVGGHATFLNPVAGVFMPVSGDDLFVDNRPVQIVEDSDWITGGRIGLRLRF